MLFGKPLIEGQQLFLFDSPVVLFLNRTLAIATHLFGFCRMSNQVINGLCDRLRIQRVYADTALVAFDYLFPESKVGPYNWYACRHILEHLYWQSIQIIHNRMQSYQASNGAFQRLSDALTIHPSTIINFTPPRFRLKLCLKFSLGELSSKNKPSSATRGSHCLDHFMKPAYPPHSTYIKHLNVLY